jgi:hypothetical protein
MRVVREEPELVVTMCLFITATNRTNVILPKFSLIIDFSSAALLFSKLLHCGYILCTLFAKYPRPIFSLDAFRKVRNHAEEIIHSPQQLQSIHSESIRTRLAAKQHLSFQKT